MRSQPSSNSSDIKFDKMPIEEVFIMANLLPSGDKEKGERKKNHEYWIEKLKHHFDYEYDAKDLYSLSPWLRFCDSFDIVYRPLPVLTAVFFSLVKEGDLQKIRQTQLSKAVLSQADVHGLFLLHVAVKFAIKKESDGSIVENLDIIKHLVEKGADVNQKTRNGDELTALHFAAAQGGLETVNYLLEKGAHIDDVTKATFFGGAIQSDKSALHLAVIKDHLDMVALLLEHGAATDLGMTEPYGGSPVQLAVTINSTKALQIFFEHDANCTTQVTKDGRSLLHLAARGSIGTLDFLLKWGLDSNQVMQDGRAALHMAVKYNGDKPDNFIAIMQCLLAHGAAINLAAQDGRTALHWAAGNSNYAIEISEQLLINGADANQMTQDGKTALHLAAQYNYLAALKLLEQQAGVSVDQTTLDGSTALNLALVSLGTPGTTRYLLDRKAKVKLDAVAGQTLFHFAVQYGYVKHLGAVTDVMSCTDFDKTHINQPMKNGKTPLHLAIERGEIELIEFLVNNGADMHANMHRWAKVGTPLQSAEKLAAMRGETENKYLRIYAYLRTQQYLTKLDEEEEPTSGWTSFSIFPGPSVEDRKVAAEETKKHIIKSDSAWEAATFYRGRESNKNTLKYAEAWDTGENKEIWKILMK